MIIVLPLRRSLDHWFDSWIDRRHPPVDRQVIHRRRLYILPTGSGYTFGALLLVLLLWSINYNNNLGFVLTFLIAAVVHNSMWRVHQNLVNIRLSCGRFEAGFVGDLIPFEFRLEELAGRRRMGIVLEGSQGAVSTPVALAPEGDTNATLLIKAEHRGWLLPGRLRVTTRYPLGLFRAWSWVTFQRAAVVYPRPAGRLPLPKAAPAVPFEGAAAGVGRDDFAGLRSYRPGDSPRHIAWKVAARHRELPVKYFTGQHRPELTLDFAEVPGDVETRLSQLCRWVLQAEAVGLSYGLRLGDQKALSPASGGGDSRRRRPARAWLGKSERR
ncbi:MAG: DUF58 domain-containing protein [Candidatus Competibacterales bacterium]